MLQRLERADRHVELDALLQVFDGGVEQPLGDTEHLGAERDAAAVENLFEQFGALARLAEHGIGADRNILQDDARSIARVDHEQAVALDAGSLGIDEEQRRAGFSAA